ncbi:MAG: helix-turn-helix domain-containing protein, partial [Bacteroidota bacterium]
FLTFINGYRVAAVKERIRNKEYIKMTFFGIAQLCGFKNKSTFYKVFRDVTGMTPKGFVEQIELEPTPIKKEVTEDINIER